MPVGMYNATVVNNGTVNTIVSPELLGGFLLLAILALVVGFVVSLTFTKWLLKKLEFASKSVVYFIKGAGVLFGSYSIYWLGTELSRAGKGIPAEYYLYAVLGFAGVSIIGWLADEAWKRLRVNFEKARK